MKTPLFSMRLTVAAGALALLSLAAAFDASARGRADYGDAPQVQLTAEDDADRDGRGRGRGRGGDDARPYVPLESIIGQIQARVPGRLVGVRGPNGQGIYRIVWETPDGRVITFVVDGRTGQILR